MQRGKKREKGLASTGVRLQKSHFKVPSIALLYIYLSAKSLRTVWYKRRHSTAMSSSIICWLGPEPACSVNFSCGRRSLTLRNYFKAPEIQASASRGLLLLLLETVREGARVKDREGVG